MKTIRFIFTNQKASLILPLKNDNTKKKENEKKNFSYRFYY